MGRDQFESGRVRTERRREMIDPQPLKSVRRSEASQYIYPYDPQSLLKPNPVHHKNQTLGIYLVRLVGSRVCSHVIYLAGILRSIDGWDPNPGSTGKNVHVSYLRLVP